MTATRRWDVVGFGEASLDEVWRLPPGFVLGDKARAVARDRLGGGQIATALVAASRLGARAAFLGPLGDDPRGDEIARGLAEDRVAMIGPRAIGARSRTALVLVDAQGGRTVLDEGGAAAADPPALAAAIGDARALHLDATHPAAALALARIARAAGTLVSIDVDHVPADLHAARDVSALLGLADACVLATGVATRATGRDDADAALAALVEAGPRGALVVETRGAAGARAHRGAERFAVPAFAVEVVDTTACGDTFRGALLVALLEGRPAQEALRFASAAAALKCRALGRHGCPTRAELEALLARRA